MPAKLVIEEGECAGQKYSFSESPLTLGSGEQCEIRVSGAGILERHLILERRGAAWHMRVLDGALPIEVDGRTETAVRLHHGCLFRIGPAAFRFLTPRATIDPAIFDGEPFADQEEAVAQLKRHCDRVLGQVGTIIVGQHSVLMQILVALFARGHCLLVGVPGLAKTLMVRTLAGTLDLDARRIQFTPDLMPADITGTDILEEDSATGKRRFRFNRGPIFANMILADEINRTPPKTQAALLEAMQEQRVTASGVTYDLPQPFLVLATQNPIELEGTYPLPEAQLDRFMFSVTVDYPVGDEETRILMETTRDRTWEVDRVLDGDTILRYQHLVRQVPVSRHVAQYAAALAQATRPGREGAPDFVDRWLKWGAGPRAGQYLLLAAKAHTLLYGQFTVSCSTVREYALPVLRHRIFRNFAAASEGISTDEIVARVVELVEEPEY